ncbi:fibrillarin-like rRNA/tRNA 2'-O-methyltransferase [Candidatus Woesearchaeota archaeon]|nr:fibrillarin-like rRNA/tRNA 2'-O-methyltransferase [Candidatus Woesearchaeota archaeon]MBW3006146.1 fibrillarin-like rRNA/tRNA 2'-O-methyltransferase [Candidatus Woesearchaeota archaeon]
MIKETNFKGIFELRKGKKKLLLTKNLVPGVSVYGEKLIKDNNIEYREWNPNKSKLAAAILKGIHQINLKPDTVVLYLGASTGTTASHVSDILGKGGFVFALDSAPRVVRELVFLCEQRPNMAPLLADANQPDTYKDKITQVDWLYQDIAQKNQVDIFLKNIALFLKQGHFALLAVKARSIDVTKEPSVIFDEVQKKLEKAVIIADKVLLNPYQKDHCLFVCKKR